MEDQADSTMDLMPGSDSKSVVVKRSVGELEEHDVSTKGIKMRDLDSVIRSKEIKSHSSKSMKRKGSSQQLQFSEAISPVTEVPPPPICLPLDLNTDIRIAIDESNDNNPECEENIDMPCSQESRCIPLPSKGISLDLNARDVPSTINHEPLRHKQVKYLKRKDVSECASSIGPVEENDSLRVWKEMKQNGFLSSSHGGISMHNNLLSSSHGGIPAPKPLGRKSKNEVVKKKMELAKKEQVDRFTKIAAPSGLLNGLNPGIINHVRNRKQVHSIIEALVKSEKTENLDSGSEQSSHVKSGNREGDVSSGVHRLSCYHEDGPSHTTTMSKKARGYLLPTHQPFSSISEERSGDGDSSKADPVSEDYALALKLSSSTKASENVSSMSNEESTNLSASSLSVKAATVASQWLELLQQDVKGRLSALRRSKKKVQAVITTELPFLISKEFFSYKGDDPNIVRTSADGFLHDPAAQMHTARWSALFDQMDKALSEEEKQLENWSNQIKGMQQHCDQGLQHMNLNVLYGLPQLAASENNIRSRIGDSFDRELAVRAAAASIYSTCDFMSSKENVACSLT